VLASCDERLVARLPPLGTRRGEVRERLHMRDSRLTLNRAGLGKGCAQRWRQVARVLVRDGCDDDAGSGIEDALCG